MPPPRRDRSLSPPARRGNSVIKLRQLHLQLPFAAARVPGENIENQLRTVEHAAFEAALKVALLHGTQIAVKNNKRHVVRVRLGTNLVKFASSHNRARIHRVAHLQNDPATSAPALRASSASSSSDSRAVSLASCPGTRAGRFNPSPTSTTFSRVWVLRGFFIG